MKPDEIERSRRITDRSRIWRLEQTLAKAIKRIEVLEVTVAYLRGRQEASDESWF